MSMLLHLAKGSAANNSSTEKWGTELTDLSSKKSAAASAATASSNDSKTAVAVSTTRIVATTAADIKTALPITTNNLLTNLDAIFLSNRNWNGLNTHYLKLRGDKYEEKTTGEATSFRETVHKRFLHFLDKTLTTDKERYQYINWVYTSQAAIFFMSPHEWLSVFTINPGDNKIWAAIVAKRNELQLKAVPDEHERQLDDGIACYYLPKRGDLPFQKFSAAAKSDRNAIKARALLWLSRSPTNLTDSNSAFINGRNGLKNLFFTNDGKEIVDAIVERPHLFSSFNHWFIAHPPSDQEPHISERAIKIHGNIGEAQLTKPFVEGWNYEPAYTYLLGQWTRNEELSLRYKVSLLLLSPYCKKFLPPNGTEISFVNAEVKVYNYLHYHNFIVEYTNVSSRKQLSGNDGKMSTQGLDTIFTEYPSLINFAYEVFHGDTNSKHQSVLWNSLIMGLSLMCIVTTLNPEIYGKIKTDVTNLIQRLNISFFTNATDSSAPALFQKLLRNNSSHHLFAALEELLPLAKDMVKTIVKHLSTLAKGKTNLNERFLKSLSAIEETISKAEADANTLHALHTTMGGVAVTPSSAITATASAATAAATTTVASVTTSTAIPTNTTTLPTPSTL